MRRDTTSASFAYRTLPLRSVSAFVQGTTLAALALFLSCSGGSSTEDMASAGDMAQRSCCGQPGDTGNSKGVGRYCSANTDPACRTSGLPANICSTAENNPNRPTFFCTMACTGATDTTTCGENATCTKNSTGLFGCVPKTCLDNLPPGCPL